MMSKTYKHIFGPIKSRRLGTSLGIDLIPYKTCCFDCIYCECGKTTNKTIERKEYIKKEEVISELNDFLKQKPKLDFITFAGSGEPTLNIKIKDIISFIKKNYKQYKTALLTNAFCLYDIKKELMDLDVIIPSLDAATISSFNKINKPHKNINFLKFINGLIDFKKDFKGRFFLEVFIIPGINDSDFEINKLKEIIEKINPDMVELNSLDRPGTDKNVKKASFEILEKIANVIPKAQIIQSAKINTNQTNKNLNLRENILFNIRRRPATLLELLSILGTTKEKLENELNILLKKRIITKQTMERGDFYCILKKD